MSRLLLGALLLAGCGAPPAAPAEAAVLEAFRPLHAPLYAAAGQDQAPEALHAHLAARLHGPALTRTYRDQAALARRARAEDTVVEVDSLRYLSVEPLPPPPDSPPGAAWLRARWTVTGTVRHQGHAHQRTNLYAADYALAQTEDGLRIVEERLVGLDRVAGGAGGEAWGPDGRPRAARPLDAAALLELSGEVGP